MLLARQWVSMVAYRVEIADLRTHQFRVTLTVQEPAAEQVLSLPAWIPGSYLIREFARHLSCLRAWQGRRPLVLEQVDKARWIARCAGRAALRVSYLVYAFDTSVRAAFLDARRGFFNGTGLCLQVEGREREEHHLELGRLPKGWQVATAMARAAPEPAGGPSYQAADYDELVDHPFELGRFWRGGFSVRGVPHEFVVAGAFPGFDGDRLLADVRRICEAQVNFWHGPRSRARPPFKRYLFTLNALEDGHGGLEHRASTALLAARRDLPRADKQALSDGYVNLLGLISHEYFHAWNVKRLKPKEFARLDYGRENYTRMLWFFEGFTSYYDDLMLRRAGLIDATRYLALLAKNVNAVRTTPGRRVQSVADSSFDAWIKYYRPDENTGNSTVSYYAKGALVALALDLRLRQHRSSLDDVMRELWRAGHGAPIGEDDLLQTLRALSGRSFQRDLASWVHGTQELPLEPLLQGVGVTLDDEGTTGLAPSLGLRLSEGPVTGVQVKAVLADGAAARSGISAGDELLAVDGWRIRKLDDALQWTSRQQAFELLLVRDQRLQSLTVRPDARSPLGHTARLSLQDGADGETLARRRAWLGQ
jgi:predicted metalloprotease with PDZ domain